MVIDPRRNGLLNQLFWEGAIQSLKKTQNPSLEIEKKTTQLLPVLARAYLKEGVPEIRTVW
jgi:hypothetical protein